VNGSTTLSWRAADSEERRYRLQLQSPLPVLQWAQRQAFDLQKQVPLGAAAFSAWVFSTGAGAGVHPIAIASAAITTRSFPI